MRRTAGARRRQRRRRVVVREDVAAGEAGAEAGRRREAGAEAGASASRMLYVPEAQGSEAPRTVRAGYVRATPSLAAERLRRAALVGVGRLEVAPEERTRRDLDDALPHGRLLAGAAA